MIETTKYLGSYYFTNSQLEALAGLGFSYYKNSLGDVDFVSKFINDELLFVHVTCGGQFRLTKPKNKIQYMRSFEKLMKKLEKIS